MQNASHRSIVSHASRKYDMKTPKLLINQESLIYQTVDSFTHSLISREPTEKAMEAEIFPHVPGGENQDI